MGGELLCFPLYLQGDNMSDLSDELLKQQFIQMAQKVPELKAQIKEIEDKAHATPCPYTRKLEEQLKEVSHLCNKLSEDLENIIDILDGLHTKADDIERWYIKAKAIFEFIHIMKIPIILALMGIVYFVFPHTVHTFINEFKKVIGWIK